MLPSSNVSLLRRSLLNESVFFFLFFFSRYFENRFAPTFDRHYRDQRVSNCLFDFTWTISAHGILYGIE